MPSMKKRASSTRKPPHPKPKAAPAPAPVADTQLAPGASDLLDTEDGPASAPAVETVEIAAPSGDTGTPEPAQEAAPETATEEAEQPAPDAPAAEEAAEEAVKVEDAEQPAPAPTTEPEQPADEPLPSPSSDGRVRLGHVDGVLHRVPLSAVQSILEPFEERIALLRTSSQVLALHERVRATEGRCAPIVFSMAPGDDRPSILSGLEHFAAAVNVELTSVFVIVVNADDAGAVQSHLAHAGNRGPSEQSEDDLVRQVLSYHD